MNPRDCAVVRTGVGGLCAARRLVPPSACLLTGLGRCFLHASVCLRLFCDPTGEPGSHCGAK